MIIIVDIGMGNLGSIFNMLKKLGISCRVSSDPNDVISAGGLILPGVGAFDTGMRNLGKSGLVPLIGDKVLAGKTPLLGICLGMQLLTEGSEEGSLPGLGWIEGRTVRFTFGPGQDALRIPHMGWNTVAFRGRSVFSGAYHDEPRFYFVHSYHVVCSREEDIAGTTVYGYPFASAVQSGNVCGVQFHPEKSHRFGMTLLKTFAEVNGLC